VLYKFLIYKSAKFLWGGGQRNWGNKRNFWGSCAAYVTMHIVKRNLLKWCLLDRPILGGTKNKISAAHILEISAAISLKIRGRFALLF